MGVYPRQLQKGLRYRFSVSVNGKGYLSPSKYLTREEAEQAEREYLALHKQDTLAFLMESRLERLSLFPIGLLSTDQTPAS